MTIRELKSVIATYLQRPIDKLTVDTPVDLVLVAINNARRSAQYLHDFNAQKVEAQIAVDASEGGLISSAKLIGTDIPVALKELITFSVLRDGQYRPIYHRPKKNHQAEIQLFDSVRNYDRYPSVESSRTTSSSEVIIFGDRVYFSPSKTETLFIDGIAWLPDYTNDSPPDIFLTHGAEYLQWAAICELNYFTQTYSPGLDGNLGPPTKARDQALQRLIAWDIMRDESGRLHHKLSL